VQHEHTGLIVQAGDADALRAALHRLHDDPELRANLGANARAVVAGYTHEAWAEGMSRALTAVGKGC
jgi:glycosyltransferase involved in cell wall biosynthesis